MLRMDMDSLLLPLVPLLFQCSVVESPCGTVIFF
jgi:hypothetical protein